MASPRGAVRAALPVLPLLPRLTMWSSPAGFSDGRGPAGLCPVAVQRRSSTGCHCSDTRRSLSNSWTGSINMTRCPVGIVLRLRRIGDRYLVQEVVADIAHLRPAVPRSSPPISLSQTGPTVREPDENVQPAQLGVFLGGQAPRHVGCIGPRRDRS